jgi:hypothetical protein
MQVAGLRWIFWASLRRCSGSRWFLMKERTSIDLCFSAPASVAELESNCSPQGHLPGPNVASSWEEGIVCNVLPATCPSHLVGERLVGAPVFRMESDLGPFLQGVTSQTADVQWHLPWRHVVGNSAAGETHSTLAR